jgi:hypothetical protein
VRVVDVRGVGPLLDDPPRVALAPLGHVLPPHVDRTLLPVPKFREFSSADSTFPKIPRWESALWASNGMPNFKPITSYRVIESAKFIK